jgi:hypothetical protein
MQLQNTLEEKVVWRGLRDNILKRKDYLCSQKKLNAQDLFKNLSQSDKPETTS